MRQKKIPTIIRFTEDERAWLDKRIEKSGRTLTGQVRVWLKKEMEEEMNAKAASNSQQA